MNLKISEQLLQVREYTGDGYQPVFDYGAWRVAILRYHDELLPHHIAKMQRHDESDEVFVLLQGRCILFIGEGKEEITRIMPQEMESLKLYNVHRAVWHTHTLSRDAMVLIVENVDTSLKNSPEIMLTDQQKKELVLMTKMLWPGENKPFAVGFN
jgi:hypothetical protein